MKEIKDDIIENGAEWKGISLEELKMQRALTLVKMEFRKEMLVGQISSVTSAPSNSTLSIFTGHNKSLSIIKYALIGYKGAKMIHNIWKKFRR